MGMAPNSVFSGQLTPDSFKFSTSHPKGNWTRFYRLATTSLVMAYRQCRPPFQRPALSLPRCRYTTAVYLFEAGVEINVIWGWLGHANLKATNRYAEITIRMKAEALKLCERTARPASRQPFLCPAGVDTSAQPVNRNVPAFRAVILHRYSGRLPRLSSLAHLGVAKRPAFQCLQRPEYGTQRPQSGPFAPPKRTLSTGPICLKKKPINVAHSGPS